ncbi:MAG: YggS family pyridoxal phosphate-dependent enzyme [Deltaproteobacteria bacterium]|nr:YggS family pyridoxal phosphate-dependent enzyme [Deltaproteobacteria bacterium]
MSVRERLAAVQARIAERAQALGRATGDITLVAVSKQQPIERVMEAYECGVRHFGENTVQGLVATAQALAAAGRQARWHFIGRLQRNKINKLLPHVWLIHTVDHDELAAALAERAGTAGVDVLVQVNVGREKQKGGVDPEQAVTFARRLTRLDGLRLRGLMAIPPAGADPHPFFARMAVLSQELCASSEGRGARELSLGMSDDFEAAIEHGATLVRVGTAIFAERKYEA